MCVGAGVCLLWVSVYKQVVLASYTCEPAQHPIQRINLSAVVKKYPTDTFSICSICCILR